MPVRRGWRRVRAWFIRLLRLDASARQIALGTAIGTFIAFTPTVGLQMLLVFLVTSVVPANRAAGLPMVWVTNPATIVPVYTFNLFVGLKLTGGSEVLLGTFEAAVSELAAMDLPWWTLVGRWWDVAMTVAVPLWVGSAVVGLVAAGAAYTVMFHLIRGYRRLHARRRAAGARRRERRSATGRTALDRQTPEGRAPDGPPTAAP